MKPSHSKKVSHKIETLCEQGCSEVNQVIAEAKKGNEIEELADFNNHEIETIIDELDQIMSIYNVDNLDKNNDKST